jgi:hypothetical protein
MTDVGQGVPCIQDEDKYATDLMKCLQAITEREAGDEQVSRPRFWCECLSRAAVQCLAPRWPDRAPRPDRTYATYAAEAAEDAFDRLGHQRGFYCLCPGRGAFRLWSVSALPIHGRASISSTSTTASTARRAGSYRSASTWLPSLRKASNGTSVRLPPLQHPVSVCTADWETSFDTQISTSNHVVAEQIEIKTDKPVVWTLELKSLP